MTAENNSFEIPQLSHIFHCTLLLFLSSSPTLSISAHGLSYNQSSQDYERIAYQEKIHPSSFPELVR